MQSQRNILAMWGIAAAAHASGVAPIGRELSAISRNKNNNLPCTGKKKSHAQARELNKTTTSVGVTRVRRA